MRFLLLDDHAQDRAHICAAVRDTFPAVTWVEVSQRAEYEAALRLDTMAVVLMEAQLPWGESGTVLADMQQRWPQSPVLMVTSAIHEAIAVAAMQHGLRDYVLKESLRRLPMAIQASLATQHLQTELQQVQARLKESQEQYDALVEEGHEVIYMHDVHGNFTWINRAAERLMGYTRAEATQLNIATVVVPEHLAFAHEMIARKVAAPHESTTYALDVLTKTGERLTLEVGTHLLCRPGRPLQIQGMARDITARARAERLLQQSEARFSTIFHTSPHTIMLTRLSDGVCMAVSDRFPQATGYQRDEVLGQSTLALRLWAIPEQRQHLAQLLRDTGEVRNFEAVFRTRDGTRKVGLVSASVITIDNTPCVLSMTQDITERRQLEEQLRQAQKMQAVGTLAGGIAHDFNNILTAILGFTELTLDEVPPASVARANLEYVLQAGERARSLIEQLLTFSRQQEQERRPMHLHLLVKEVLTWLRAALPATIAVRHYLDEQAGPVLADPIQMHQLLLNLCTNAEHAMRQSGGLLEVHLETLSLPQAQLHPTPDLPPGDYVRLRVCDTGCGMAPAVVERIFEPFFTTKGVGEGSGLGLAVVHGIVTGHGGGMTVESLPGCGTTLAVYLPRSAASVPSADPPIEMRVSGQGHILFVDDEPPLAQLGKELLTRLGYKVTACTSSTEALRLFSAAPASFDVLITDQTMPGLTGEALVRAVRQVRPDLPVILCTGFSHTMTEEKARALGVNAFYLKPLSLPLLSQILLQVLERQAPSRR